MRENPKISLVASGIKIHLWKGLYESLEENDVSFEIIVTGHIKPNFKLPPNFKHIFSKTKPSQCAEISARNASGEYIMLIGDDVFFYPGYLDKILKFYEENCSYRDCVSGQFKRGDRFYSQEDYKFWPGVKNSPVMPICQFLKTQLWKDLGGVDKRFIAVFWDLDLNLRLFENGGKSFICESCICEEVYFPKNLDIFSTLKLKMINKINTIFFSNKAEDGLYKEYGISEDRPFLDSIWTKSSENVDQEESIYAERDGKTHLFNRLVEVEPFQDFDILTKSQGPPGRWDS